MANLRYAFTLNNYTDGEIEHLRTQFSNPELVRYALFGYEVGDSGTPHLQGYVAFVSKQRFARAKTIISERAHLEIAIGSESENTAYCMKTRPQDPIPNEIVEKFGKPSAAGKRKDIDVFKDAVLNGERSLKSLRLNHSEVMAKYPRFTREFLLDYKENIPIPDHADLYPWQQELKTDLESPPDARKIIFMVGTEGNNGKSWFAKYYRQLHPETTVVMRPAKKSDMAYHLPDDEPYTRVLFMDCARGATKDSDNIAYIYPFLEELKDGCVFSPKYESMQKEFPPLHVVVFMNNMPDDTMLSRDRYDIRVI
jgi:Putative viral replication protein